MAAPQVASFFRRYFVALTNPTDSPRASAPEPFFQSLSRVALFLSISLILCPVRFWPIEHGVDSSWVFASNYAATQGLLTGRDIFWTTGPLGNLVFPQDLGGNLINGLRFQFFIWGVVLVLVADLIFIARFPLRNLAFFTFFLSLSSPIYWFNYVGLDNLILVLTLVMLTIHRFRGRRIWYLSALVLVGILPLIKLTGVMYGALAIIGFLLDRVMILRWRVLPEVMLAAIVPVSTFTLLTFLLIGPIATAKYLRVSFEISRGYSMAMSLESSIYQVYSCIAVLALVSAALMAQYRSAALETRFVCWMLSPILAISVKHGFVRGDGIHTANFFCFAALVLGLVYLSTHLKGKQTAIAVAVAVLFVMIWQPNVVPIMGADPVLLEASGLRPLELAASAAFSTSFVQNKLQASSMAYYKETRMESELRDMIGNAEVASLSNEYNWAAMDGLRLRLFPIIQRYTAYTPTLDRMNADWVVAHGPRYVLFDGQTIDKRSILAETPATWLEIYRWYDLRLQGARNLLLERRLQPRFSALQSISKIRRSLRDQLPIPEMREPVLLSMKCALSPIGSLRNMLLSVPSVHMNSFEENRVYESRILPEVLSVPAIINIEHSNMAEFAGLLQKDISPSRFGRIKRLAFSGPGVGRYQPECEFEFFRMLTAP